MSDKKQNRNVKNSRYHKQKWKLVTAILSLFVVFATVSALVLPAVTLNKSECLLQEHRHTSECYETAESQFECSYDKLCVHQHTKECYDEQENIVCGFSDFVIHSHDSLCYKGDELVCELPEIQQHLHTKECYYSNDADENDITHTDEQGCVEKISLTCTLQEVIAHTHCDDCYGVAEEVEQAIESTDTISATQNVEVSETTQADEITQVSETTVLAETTESFETTTSTEIAETTETTQVVEESQSSAVIESTQKSSESLILTCGQVEVLVHQHTESCFIQAEPALVCQLTEHTHSVECESVTENSEDEFEDVSKVEDLVAQIPEIEEFESNLTEKSEQEQIEYKQEIVSQINECIDSYTALNDEEKSAVTNFPELEKYDSVIAENDDVQNVIAQITGLPDVNEFDEKYQLLSAVQKQAYVEDIYAQINNINALYANLTDEQKEEVLSYYKVTELEKHLNEHVNSQGGLEFVADDYKTIVVTDENANLPKDTVITARSVYDSDEFSISPFSLFSEDEESAGDETYYEEIVQAVTWGNVTKVKLFDITLTSNEQEVQPESPVEVRTEFTQPIDMQDGDVIYGVHFGDNGVEILPADAEYDQDGNVDAVTHTQSSFSVTGYVLVHLHNPNDIGPDVLPVHYCLWVNDQWTIVGSTKTGWYGEYNPNEGWPPASDKRDYITMDQMISVLGEYGLKADDDAQRAALSETVWYQRAEIDGKTVRHDTTPELKTITDANGNTVDKYIFLLSGNKVKDEGYYIYYVPEGTESGKESDTSTTYENSDLLGADLTQESKFYTMTVRDMNHVVYAPGEELPDVQILKYGSFVSVTVKANNVTDPDTGDVTKMGWQWVNYEGNVVNGITRLYDENRNGIFEDSNGDDRFTYTDNGDGTETYTFVTILGRTTLIPYSVAVDGAEQSTQKHVDLVVHLDGKWQKVGQLNLMYKHDGVCEKDGEPLWFITAGQVYTILQDFGFTDPLGANDITKDGYTFCHTNEAFDENADPADITLYADGIIQKFNGTIAIGMSNESDSFTLFYLPGSSAETKDDIHGKTAAEYANSELIKGDRFYSLQVEDDYQLVYYGYETEGFNVNVREGESVTVSVQNELSVLWSVREPWATDKPESYVKSEYTVSYDDSFNVYEFSSVNGPILIEASSLNPSFTVQYFADIVTYELSETDSGGLAVINTKNPSGTGNGGILPKNSTTPSKLYLTLDKTDIIASENNGDKVNKYEVHQEIVTQMLYKEKSFSYDVSHTWKNIDKLWNNSSYTIDRISILKDGRDPHSENMSDWWNYDCVENGANISFVNIASEEYAPRVEGVDQPAVITDENGNEQVQYYKILVTEGMVLRLTYALETGDTTFNNVSFFDYDITNGVGPTYDSGIEGINDRSNYPGTPLAGGGNDVSIAKIYAFGNQNCGSGLSSAKYNGYYINRSNVSNTFKGCSFGLVQNTLDSDGKLQWNVYSPDIFNEKGISTKGRTDYTDGTLTFKKWGDVYVLSAANSGAGSREGLEYLFNPSPYSGKTWTTIFTNNFWVVDNATDRADPNWGKSGAGVSYSSRSDSASDDILGGRTKTGTFPISDDGQAHNSFFGMKYSINFSVSEDYVGPLSYVFFGDDDMWVYLDGQLVCDIGGVHSSVGEYVDLRDYLPIDGENTVGDHTLTFYYTERGTSGSTCWMSFTLPSVTSSVQEDGTSKIVLKKELTDIQGGEIVSEEKYDFTVLLYTDESKKNPVSAPFSVQVDRADGETDYFATQTGSKISIAAGDIATIRGVPIGTWYVIQEDYDDRFIVRNSIGENGMVVEGLTVQDETVEGANYVTFINVQKGYLLPNTGGIGDFPYIFSGIALMGAVSLIMYIKKRKSKKGGGIRFLSKT